MAGFQNLVDLLRSRCDGTEAGVTHILGDETEVRIPYRELYTRARRVLGALQQTGLKKGDELVFQLGDNALFLDLFWACLMGGIVAVPLSVGRHEETRLKVFRVWRKLNRPWLVADQTVLADLQEFAKQHGLQDIAREMNQNCILSERLYDSGADGEIGDPYPDDLAFLQFSSGSTGNSKGVMLTHANLLANISGMVEALGVREPWLSWMPLTHDMGLIACHLAPLFAGANLYLMPTELFVRRPTLWLKKASEHRVKVLASPNFGYKYFLLHFKPDAAIDWDLSQVEVIINGAEPISVSLCDEFLGALAPFGLKPTVMTPGYGLAEASVCVSLQPVGEPMTPFWVDRESLGLGQIVREMADRNHPNAVALVDEGYVIANCAVRICDDENHPVGPMTVGHIQIRGLNVTQGYYNDPEATAAVISPDGWLDTGDLGFMRNGRLVVTGRAKDVIFVAGQNYYSHDIERVVEQVDGLDLGKVAACGVYSETTHQDEIVVFVVHKKDLKEFAALVPRVKRQVGSKMGLPVRDVVPIKALPKTTSGKVQRYRLAEMYRAGAFHAVLEELNQLVRQQTGEADSSLYTETERALLATCREVLGIDGIDIHHNLSDYGVTSSLLAQIQARIDELYPGRTTLSAIFAHPTIAKLAHFIDYGGSIALPRLSLPRSYFTQAGGNRGTVTLRLTLDWERTRRLTAIAAEEGVTPDVVLLAVYAHLLSLVAGVGSVGIQVLIGPVRDQIQSLELPLNEMEDFTTLCREIAAQSSGEVITTTYSVRDIGKIRLDRSATEIVPLFYNREFLTVNTRLLDVYDVTMEVSHRDGQVTCICEFDAGRLLKEAMTELMEDYLHLIHQVLEESAELVDPS